MTTQDDIQWLSVEPEMVFIPAGEFIMGSDPENQMLLQALSEFPGKIMLPALNERPKHRLYLPDYYLSKTPITNAQYARFVQDTGYRAPMEEDNNPTLYKDEKHIWRKQQPPKGRENHPVAYVRWTDAMAYCHWLTELTGRQYTLPSEAEWEKGARGTDGRIFPWGDDWLLGHCHSYENYDTGKQGENQDTSVVGSYPSGVSPYGLLDMSGNVSEWTRSRWGEHSDKLDFPYPYHPKDGREEINSPDGLRVTRGGCFVDMKSTVRCAYREFSSKGVWHCYTGFRVAISPISE